MPWSLTVGRFGGTAVKIHITFVLFLAWIAASAWASGGAEEALDSTLFIVLLFLCVVLHEFGHILAARRYGIQSPVVTLLPIGGVASMQRLPSDPRQELVVALAGPAVNLVIGVALVLVLGSLRPGELAEIQNPRLSLAGRLAAANLFLAVFNLIPAFPMDGGRVLHALLAMRVGGALATEIAAKVGQAFAIGLGFLGLFGNPLLLFIAIFVYMAAAGEAQMSAAQQALKGLTVGEAMETRFTPIAIDATLGQAVDALLATAQAEFPVVDAFMKPVGRLTRDNILSAVGKHGRDEPASVVMRLGVDSVRPSAPIERVFERLQDPKAATLYVVDADGAIVGLLSRQALAEIVLIRSVRPDWRFDGRA
jgi:Zn-dependent protease/predicted transcriptional regulator